MNSANVSNASQLYNLAFKNKRRIDNRFGADKYRLLAESLIDADFREPGDLPPVAVAIHEGDTGVPDAYGFLELNQEKPRVAKIHFAMTDEVMLLRVLIDRLACSGADTDLLDTLRSTIQAVGVCSKRAVRPPDAEVVKKPKKEADGTLAAETTKESA